MCPRSQAFPVLFLVGFFLSRSQQNSWWKCRQSCLLCASRSRSSAIQFLLVVANGLFKVFPQDGVQQRRIIVKVFPQDRVQQRRILVRNAFLSGLWSRPFPLLVRNAFLSELWSRS